MRGIQIWNFENLGVVVVATTKPKQNLSKVEELLQQAKACMEGFIGFLNHIFSFFYSFIEHSKGLYNRRIDQHLRGKNKWEEEVFGQTFPQTFT